MKTVSLVKTAALRKTNENGHAMKNHGNFIGQHYMKLHFAIVLVNFSQVYFYLILLLTYSNSSACIGLNISMQILSTSTNYNVQL